MSREDFLPDFLTRAQREAVTYRGGPLLIIAGPGSGKTEVISWRVAYLIASGAATPDSVLAVTFTEKAALELKDRIQSRLPHVNVERMQVSTIHSLCHRLLVEFADRAPFPQGLNVLDGPAQTLFVFAHRDELGLGSVLKGRLCDFIEEVVRTYNLASEEMVEPEAFAGYCRREWERAPQQEKDLWRERCRVAESYGRYLSLLRENRSTDFANLQRHALELLQSQSDVLSAVRDRFTEVLVDEYQDTNAIQDRLLCLIASGHRHLTVVGDDDQSIYRFRGATVRNILTFSQRMPGAKVVRLEHNFRSLQPIVKHSLRVISRNSSARVTKRLLSTRTNWKNDIVVVHGRTAAEEAEAVADLLRRLKARGSVERYGDVCLLLRSVRSYGAEYLSAFDKAGLPYRVTGDGALFQETTIAQLCDLLTFLHTPRPWADRYVRHDLMGLGASTKRALRKYRDDLLALDGPAALKDIGITDPRDLEKLGRLLDLKRRVQAKRQGSALETLYRLIAISGCLEAAEPSLTKKVGILTGVLRNYDEHADPADRRQLLEYLRLLKQRGLDRPPLGPQDAIQVMTVHQAKGLEFPVVVIGAAMEGRFPCRRRRPFYEVPHALTATGPPEVADTHTVDERKLFYVAATRARDLLIIGTADVVNKRGGGPSRFIGEMLGEDLDRVLRRSRASLERGPRVVSPPPPPTQPRRRLSFQQLSYFLQCPLRFRYLVLDGLALPPADYLYFGTSVHRALDRIHRLALEGRPPGRQEVEAIVEMAWAGGPRRRPRQETFLKAAAIRQISSYLEKFGHTLGSVADSEAQFAFDFQGAVISGRIDLVRRTPSGGFQIVDFKTVESKKGLPEQTDVQLGIYALGASKGLGLDVEATAVHFLADGVEQSSEWSASRCKEIEGLLGEVLGRIRSERFHPRPDYCPECWEFRAICPHVPGSRRRAG